MSVEKVLASTNVKQIRRILNFYDKLIVKNFVEANNLETDESEALYTSYKAATEKTDTFSDYTFLPSIQNIWFSEADIIALGTYGLNDLYFKGDNRAVSFLNRFRSERIAAYVELNPYYRPFVGLPRDESEFIYVTNEDAGPAKIPVHIVTSSLYPFTYDRLFTKRNIDLIIGEYPSYTYLKFLEKPLSPYYVREAPQYTIFSYTKSALNSQELEAFFKSYEAMRRRVLTVDYIEGYDDIYSDYSNQMLLLLLYGSFLHFCNSYLEAYSLRNYTDVEIYDILDSNGLSSLKGISIDILRKVVMQLPELLVQKGSDQVLDKILDIISEETITVKRYYLTKKYKVDNTSQVHIDPKEAYDRNVDLEFVEKIIRGKKSTGEPLRIPYHTFIKDDDTWGGAVDATDAESKYAIKETLRKEILKMDFSSIITKYINVSKTIEVIEKTARVSDMFALMLQIDQMNNFFYEDKILYDGVEVAPVDIWAAFCWATAKSNNVPSPNIIISDAYSISDVMYLRNSMGISQFVKQVESDEIALGDYTRTMKIKDILKDVNIIDYIVTFGYTANSTVSDILEQYEDNRDIYNKVLEKIAASSTLAELNAWNRIREINTVSKRISSLFSGYMTYDSFLLFRSSDFLNLIKPTLEGGNTTPQEQEAISSLAAKISASFRKYVQDKTSGILDIPSAREMANGGDSSMNDIRLLLSEFTSIYTELYKIEFYQGFNDVPYNTINLAFDLVRSIAKLKTNEVLVFTQGIYKDVHSARKAESVLIDEEYKLIHKMKVMTDITESEFNISMHHASSAIRYRLSDHYDVTDSAKSQSISSIKDEIVMNHTITEL